MKKSKLFTIILAAALVLTCFTACGNKEGENPATTNPPAADSETTTAPEKAQITFDINKFEKDKVSVEFVELNGMKDEGIQIKLNQTIKEFYTWQWLNEDPEDTTEYTGTAKYYCKGNYLSVVRILDVTAEGAAHPVSEISAQTYDLSTGNVVETLFLGGKEVKAVSDKFALTHPDAEVPGAAERFAAFLDDAELIATYYLTDNGIAIYMPDVSHAEGDYWVFEASYEDVSGALTPEAAAQIK